MLTWFKDVWEGFWTVLVGMKITWRHLFTQKVTLQYPEERWQLPPKSRMRLFMKYEDCIGCGQCARACPVQCIYILSLIHISEPTRLLIISYAVFCFKKKK